MTNYVYIATSLDGFIATSNGSIEWLDEIPNPEQNDFGYADFMRDIDALVMGRKTFEKVLTFDDWPYDRPVFVLTRSKMKVPRKLEDKIEFISGNPRNVVSKLNKLGHHNLYIDGGFTIQSFLEEDLIDEMIITRVPILLGSGIPLFGQLTRRLHFKHKSTEVLNDILVKSHYIRKKE
jgi:dihydrofolate reductase